MPASTAERPWWGEFVCSGSSAVLAYVFTNPVDVVKTRMALQGARAALEQPLPRCHVAYSPPPASALSVRL